MGASVYPLLARGVFATYGYFIVDDDTGHAILIDPGAQPELFLRAAEERGWVVDKILLTHGHFDHMGAAGKLRDAWNAPIYAHSISPMYLEDPQLNLSASHGLDITLDGTYALADGDVVTLDSAPDIRLEVMHVPGHTNDSVAYKLNGTNIVFVGDTVYDGGPGLTIFPTGNTAELRQSIDTRILTLPSATQLLSGHADPTSVASLAYRMGQPLG